MGTETDSVHTSTYIYHIHPVAQATPFNLIFKFNYQKKNNNSNTKCIQ